MLRLVEHRDESGGVRIHVEGRMVSPWLELLETECHRALEGEGPVTLDLSGVTYVGPPGVEVLRRLVEVGARLERVPGLIAEMLDPGT